MHASHKFSFISIISSHVCDLSDVIGEWEQANLVVQTVEIFPLIFIYLVRRPTAHVLVLCASICAKCEIL